MPEASLHSSCPATSRRQRGFTLIELMIVLVVLTISAMVVMPQYQHLMARQQLDGTARALLASLLYARNQALTHGLPVRVCPLGGEHECGAHWSAGWQVMAGDEAGAFRVIDTHALDRALTLARTDTDTGSNPVGFTAQGYLSEATNGFRLEHDDEVDHVCITLSGQASIRDGACNT